MPSLVRTGPDRLAVVRLRGPADFVPHAYAEEGFDEPVNIDVWARKLGAPVVFNAGQFDADGHHLGWLKGRDRWLSPALKGSFKGLLLSGLRPGDAATANMPWASILDLERGDALQAQAYSNVVQSMMLLDEGARARVRQSDLAACRTVVAEDTQGRMLIIASEGAVTLHDLADWLQVSGLSVVRAMNLDGGAESQLAVTTPELKMTLFGQYGNERMLPVRPSVAQAPLPAVIAVYPAGMPPASGAGGQ